MLKYYCTGDRNDNEVAGRSKVHRKTPKLERRALAKIITISKPT